MHIVLLEQSDAHNQLLSELLERSSSLSYQKTSLETLLGNVEHSFPESPVLFFCEVADESESFWRKIKKLQGQYPQWPIVTFVQTWSPTIAFQHLSRGVQECLSLQHLSLEQARYVFSTAWIRQQREYRLEQFHENHHELELSYRALFENASDVIFISTPDGQLMDINQAGLEIFGYPSKEELLSLNTEELYLDPEQRNQLQRRLEAEGSVQNMELCLKRKDGQLLFVSESANTVRNHQGEVIGYRGIIRDITDSKRRQQALRRSEERYAAAMAGVQDGVWDWNLRTERFYFSKRWQEIVRWDDVQGSPETIEDWFSKVHPEDRVRLRRALDAHLKGESDRLEVEHRLGGDAKEAQWVMIRGKIFRDENGKPERMAGAIRDISAQKHREQHLRFTASHDTLTGLPNRALFVERLEELFARFQADPSRKFAVLFLDLDGFKNVNDTFGHSTGDQLLMAFSGRLKNCVRTQDLAARFGGDEFGVLIQEVDTLEDAIRVAKRILDALKPSFRVDHHVLQTNASIGVAISHPGYNDVTEILRRADSSMYRAKREGKGRYCVVDMNQSPLAIIQREDWVQRSFPEAIEKQQLSFEWVPICSLATGERVAGSLYVHWHHPTQGLLIEEDFLPLLLQAGLESQWNQWWSESFSELLQDVELLRKWKRVHFHLTESLLLHDTISQHLQKTEYPMEQFVLEVSERQLLDWRLFRATLTDYEKQGIRFCLRDFGKRGINLEDLHALPFSFLQSQLKTTTDTSRRVLKSIKALSIALSAELVLTGVDTKKTLEELKGLGYQYGRGKALRGFPED